MGNVAIFKGKLVKFLAKAGILVPARGDADRSVTPTAGETAFNTDANKLEVYNGASWEQLSQVSFPSNNIGIGDQSLELSTGNNNIAIGYSSFNSSTGSYNISLSPGGSTVNGDGNVLINGSTLPIFPATTINNAIVIVPGTGGSAPAIKDNQCIFGNPSSLYKFEGIFEGINIGQNINNTSFIVLKSDFTGGPVTWTLPASNGSNGQTLVTNGSGTLTWSNISGSNINGPIYSRNSGQSTRIYGKKVSTTLANRVVGTWQTETSSPGLGYWSGITWSKELGLFVAVGKATDGVTPAVSQIATSPDGLVWTSRVVPEANTWNNVCWGAEAGRFVAVASSGTNRLMHSTDGITWNVVNIGTNLYQDVCWSPELGVFVAVNTASSNQIIYSSDGISWSTYNIIGGGTNHQSICWSSELQLFCLVGNATGGISKVKTSPSPTGPWTNAALPPSLGTDLKDVCWSPDLGLFCAVSSTVGPSIDSLYISSDGSNWQQATSAPSDCDFTGVSWSAELGLFCAVSSAGVSRIVTSPDGLSWTARTQVGTPSFQEVIWSPEKSRFCAVSNTNGGGNFQISKFVGLLT